MKEIYKMDYLMVLENYTLYNLKYEGNWKNHLQEGFGIEIILMVLVIQECFKEE